VLLVGVPDLTDAALELDPSALLHDVRRLVRRSEQRRTAIAERHVRARGVGFRAHRPGALGCIRIGVGLDTGHVVVPERRLDRGEMRKRTAASRDAVFCSSVNVRAAPTQAHGWKRRPSSPLLNPDSRLLPVRLLD
jgi:hypothetical protein